jgi:hypothetical protein
MKFIKKDVFDFGFIILTFLIAVGVLVIVIGFVQGIENLDISNEITVLNSSEILSKGRNFVVFEDYIYVSKLIYMNDLIEAVSYYDSYSQESVGYVNIFGGIGNDFLIIPGREYEIFVKEETKLVL